MEDTKEKGVQREEQENIENETSIRRPQIGKRLKTKNLRQSIGWASPNKYCNRLMPQHLYNIGKEHSREKGTSSTFPAFYLT